MGLALAVRVRVRALIRVTHKLTAGFSHVLRLIPLKVRVTLLIIGSTREGPH